MSELIEVVGAVVLSGGAKQVLLLGKRYGEHGRWWSFPGGKLEPGETPIDALERECLQEISVKPSRALMLGKYQGRAPDGQSLLLTMFLTPDITRERIELAGEYAHDGELLWADAPTCERLIGEGKVLGATALGLRHLIGMSWLLPDYRRKSVAGEQST